VLIIPSYTAEETKLSQYQDTYKVRWIQNRTMNKQQLTEKMLNRIVQSLNGFVATKDANYAIIKGEHGYLIYVTRGFVREGFTKKLKARANSYLNLSVGVFHRDLLRLPQDEIFITGTLKNPNK
jgi:hypothetical protein